MPPWPSTTTTTTTLTAPLNLGFESAGERSLFFIFFLNNNSFISDFFHRRWSRSRLQRQALCIVSNMYLIAILHCILYQCPMLCVMSIIFVLLFIYLFVYCHISSICKRFVSLYKLGHGLYCLRLNLFLKNIFLKKTRYLPTDLSIKVYQKYLPLPDRWRVWITLEVHN